MKIRLKRIFLISLLIVFTVSNIGKKKNYNIESYNILSVSAQSGYAAAEKFSTSYMNTVEDNNIIPWESEMDDFLNAQHSLNHNIIKSSKTKLAGLSVYGYDLKDFSMYKNEYTVEVSGAISTVPGVAAEAMNPKARITVKNADNLPGQTIIKVTAEDGSEELYVIKFVVPFKVIIDTQMTSPKIIKGENVTLKIKVENDYPEEKEVTLLMCLYDSGGRMVKYISNSKRVGTKKAEDLETVFSVPDDGFSYHVKAFIIDNVENMNPLWQPIDIH